jgi:signal transduction histidine kinase
MSGGYSQKQNYYSSALFRRSDNGKGFEPPESLGVLPPTGKLGLVGMQERVQLLGGRLKLESKPGKGTKIFVEGPV